MTAYRLLVLPRRIPDDAWPFVPALATADVTVDSGGRLSDLAATVMGNSLAITQVADVKAQVTLAPEVAAEPLVLVRVPIHDDDGTLAWADAVTHPVGR